MEKKRGYKVQGRFYEYVPVQEWLHRDFKLVRRLADMSVVDFFGGKADLLTLKQGLSGVAVWHAQPELELDQIETHLGMLKPGQIEEEGFDEADLEVDADPPAESVGESETPASNSSANIEDMLEENPETSAEANSGEPGSDIGSPASSLAS